MKKLIPSPHSQSFGAGREFRSVSPPYCVCILELFIQNHQIFENCQVLTYREKDQESLPTLAPDGGKQGWRSLGHWGQYSVYGPCIPYAPIIFFLPERFTWDRGQLVETFLSLPVCTVTVFSHTKQTNGLRLLVVREEGISPLSPGGPMTLTPG